VLKHFPGHGAASGDSHELLPVTPPLDELRTRDLVPYRSLAGSGAAVMVGHLSVPGLTEPGVPASLSPTAITDLLRGQYGYADALVFTDALGMAAVLASHTIPEAAELAVGAGADVVIYTATEQTPQVIDRLAEAVATGRIDEARIDDAVGRVLARKALDMCSFAALLGELES
jgi:beta-N-acetylhexosaminidase